MVICKVSLTSASSSNAPRTFVTVPLTLLILMIFTLAKGKVVVPLIMVPYTFSEEKCLEKNPKQKLEEIKKLQNISCLCLKV